MLTIRSATDRYRTRMGWLDSAHTFSFGTHYDPSNLGYRALRVINDDRVAPGGGFPPHPHRDMEIISYVVEGALEHRDSMGNGSVIQAGDVQLMRAGTGVTHSEYNASQQEAVRFLQIWIPPRARGLEPSYQQRHFPPEARRGRLRLLVDPEGTDQALQIAQDARLYGALLAPAQTVEHPLALGRHAWIQIVRGQVEVDGYTLSEGDSAAIHTQDTVRLTGVEDAELLVFDLA